MAWSRILSLSLLAWLACGQASAETLLIEFTSPDCGPCRRMRPVIERLLADGYAVRNVDVAREPDVAARYQITNYPTFIVLIDHRERARLVGGTSHAQLVEMIHKAAAIAASQAPLRPDSEGGLALVNAPAVGGANAAGPAALDQPQPNRVVSLQSEPPISRTGPRTKSAPVANGPLAASPATGVAVDRLIAASVRISIEDPEGKSTGAGAIVDARQGKALVLTCGHLFRASGGKGPIQISLFTAGPNGPELRTTVEGTLIDFDLDRDLALVCFVTNGAVEVASIAPAGTPMLPGMAVTSVGCEHGANPTAWATRVTAVDRYQGHPNIEAAGAPVEGRSGGGLFNAAGQVVGVCYAADPQGDEGLYAALPSIHAKLDSLGLSKVYQQPSTGTMGEGDATTSQVAASPSPFQVRGQNPTPGDTAVLPAAFGNATPPVTPATAAATTAAAPAPAVSDTSAALETAPLAPEEQAALVELNRRGADSEVICIIRPQTPGGRSEVIKLDRASPAFVRAVGGGSIGDASRSTPAADVAANATAAPNSPWLR